MANLNNALYSKDAEEALLGSVLMDPGGMGLLHLEPESFYVHRHRFVWEAMLSLLEKSYAVDVVTVAEELERAGKLAEVGGSAFLAALIMAPTTSVNAESYARIVKDKASRRSVVEAANELARAAYDESKPIDDAVITVSQKLTGSIQPRGSAVHLSQYVKRLMDDVEERAKNPQDIFGLETGVMDFDRITGGLQPGEVLYIGGDPGIGKCLGKGTKVLMFDGTLKTVENIRIGEQLMGTDSHPRTVLSIARGRQEMFWVHQKHGISYRVNANHILALKRSRNRNGHIRGEILLEKAIDAYMENPGFFDNWKGYKTSVEFPHKILPVDPYFLGIWLGDGSSWDSFITTADPEVVNFLEEYARKRSEYVTVGAHKKSIANYYRITGGRSRGRRGFSIQTILKDLDLLQNKHIPTDFLVNSRENRLLLLAGLIDSDGHYPKGHHGPYEIVLANKSLASQVKFLVDSLGYRTSITEKVFPFNGKPYRCWRVVFNGNVNEIPVRVKRKKAMPWTAPIDWQVTGIHIEKDIVDDFYGFNLDGDGLFLLEDMTVTHNSMLSMQMGIGMATKNKPGAIYSLEMLGLPVARRIVSGIGQIDTRKLKSGRLSDEEWTIFCQACEAAAQLPVYLSDASFWTTAGLRADLARLRQQNKIEWFVLDYLLLLSDGEGRLDEIERSALLSKRIKMLTKEFELAGITVNSVTKDGQDIRGSNQVKHDADVIMMLTEHQPEMGGKPKPNMRTCVFKKGRELADPRRYFHLVKADHFPAFRAFAPDEKPAYKDWTN